MAIIASDKDTRERPKKKSSYRAITRLPKTRTKTGCFTCRKRKKKCDENGPVCKGCSRNFLQCVWPSNPTETLPKDFKISSCTDSSFNKNTINNNNIKSEINSCISIPDIDDINDIDNDNDLVNDELSNIPATLCSVLEVKSYKHKIPFPLKATIPDSIDFIIDSISPKINNTKTIINNNNNNNNNNFDLLNENITNSYVDHQTISQLFDSLYNKSLLDSANSNINNNISSNSPSDNDLSTDSFYNDLLNYHPKSNYYNSISNSISIKNPIIASFREIFYARGCLYLAKNNNNQLNITEKYNKAANKHYNNSILIIKNFIDPKSQILPEHWMILSIKTLCLADKLLGLVSENCISNLISTEFNFSNDEINSTLNGFKDCSNLNFNKILFSQVLFIYPFLIYFSKFESLLEMLPPNKLFQIYNKEMIQIFLNNNDIENNDIENNDNKNNWIFDVINTAIINIIQNLVKMIWILRMKNSIEIDELNLNLKQLKTDISLIWTTIQTAEIQFDNECYLIDFAKLSHMSSEILFLAINNNNNNSINSSSPIIGFYLDQFMLSYENYLKNTNNNTNNNNNNSENNVTGKVGKCFFLLPLFIAACSAQSLYQKEFISKELYLISSELGYEFIENLTSTIEDCWCNEQNGGVDTLTRFISRDGFSKLTKV